MSKHSSRSPKKIDSYRRRKPHPLFQAVEESTAASVQRQQQRIDSLIKSGIDAYQNRKLDDASAYLSNALALQPDHALANNCLGVVRRIQGNLSEAIACYLKALETDPQYAEAYNNLGVAYEAAGELEQAIAAYQAALRNKPDNAAAQNNLGNSLTKSDRAEAAIEHLREAVRLQPGLAAAHNNLGLAYSRLGRYAEAEQSFRQSINLQPKFPEAYLNLGNVLRAAGKLDRAAECYNSAIQYQPTFASAHVGIGNVLYDQGQLQAAVAAYGIALQLQPGCAEGHFGLGNALSALKSEPEAAIAWRRALELRPDYAEAHNNLGTMYHRQGHTVLAEKEFVEALQTKPNLLAAHNNLGNLYREQDRMDLAAKSYAAVLNRQPPRTLAKLRLSTLCPAVWNSLVEIRDYTERIYEEWCSLRGVRTYQDLPDLLSVANEPPYNLQFLSTNIRPLKEAYANIFRYSGPTFRSEKPGEKIKLGFVVTPSHEIAFLRLIWGALKRLNTDEFERTIICTATSADVLRATIQSDQAQILEMPEQPHRILHAIRERHFDLLHYFEICTDALNYFLPFFRLAPVQVTSWGIQVTSGIPQVDAYLSSDLVETPEAQEHYTERLCRAETLLTYQAPVETPTNGKTRQSFGFDSTQHLYFCVQHLGKFHPDFDPVLAEILRHDQFGVVVTTQDKHGYGAQRLRERFQREIPDVAERIVILPRQAFSDYFSLAAVSDVMLDPIHFGGVTTTYDCLSLNKPIVTWPSAFHRGRYTLGCYRRMGLLDCVANSAEEYVRTAVKLGTDAEYRQFISDRINETKWRLFEDCSAVSEHERLFRDLVNRSRQQ